MIVFCLVNLGIIKCSSIAVYQNHEKFFFVNFLHICRLSDIKIHLFMSEDPISYINNPRMVVRSNLAAPDILIYQDENFEDNLKQIFDEVENPSSVLFIETDYLRYRSNNKGFQERLNVNFLLHSFCILSSLLSNFSKILKDWRSFRDAQIGII